MFINEVKTDGYTCRFTFVQARRTQTTAATTKLELHDFTIDEIERHFRPCTVDPGRSQVFTSYHGNGQLRRFSTKEYYSFGGTISRARVQDRIKVSSRIKETETQIPSPNTVFVDKYLAHVLYLLQKLGDLFRFYGFNTCEDRWLNYLAKQRSKEEAVNVLINGGKKYNRTRRKKKKTSRNKSRRRDNRRNKLAQTPDTIDPAEVPPLFTR